MSLSRVSHMHAIQLSIALSQVLHSLLVYEKYSFMLHSTLQYPKLNMYLSLHDAHSFSCSPVHVRHEAWHVLQISPLRNHPLLHDTEHSPFVAPATAGWKSSPATHEEQPYIVASTHVRHAVKHG